MEKGISICFDTDHEADHGHHLKWHSGQDLRCVCVCVFFGCRALMHEGKHMCCVYRPTVECLIRVKMSVNFFMHSVSVFLVTFDLPSSPGHLTRDTKCLLLLIIYRHV